MQSQGKSSGMCSQCGIALLDPDASLYGYPICSSCQSNLALMQDKTIRKHIDSYARGKEQDASQPSYQEEVEAKLKFLEKTYVSRKIKLLHIQERLEHL